MTAEFVPLLSQGAAKDDSRIFGYSRFVPGVLSLPLALLLAGCETDLEKLNSSHSCVLCYLKDVDLTGADLKGVNLNWGFLEQARLDSANLSWPICGVLTYRMQILIMRISSAVI